jgi:hypothetical protein
MMTAKAMTLYGKVCANARNPASPSRFTARVVELLP